uniref:thioredoxin-dependent peroxiredoxin n=1 Tax=Sinocyclocheilus grahami TaxID=75366 RepID=A0A672QZB5_SINGR
MFLSKTTFQVCGHSHKHQSLKLRATQHLTPGFTKIISILKSVFQSQSHLSEQKRLNSNRLIHSTFVCPTEIMAFNNHVHQFQAINFTHLAWINTPKKQGGLGPMKIPLLSDLTHQISKDYGVFLEDQGHTLRGLFIIDVKGVLRQITMNDLPVGRSVDETLRLVQAFQYTDKHGEGTAFINRFTYCIDDTLLSKLLSEKQVITMFTRAANVNILIYEIKCFICFNP